MTIGCVIIGLESVRINIGWLFLSKKILKVLVVALVPMAVSVPTSRSCRSPGRARFTA
jgi:hypothetical protein